MIRASIYGRLGGDPVGRQTRNGKAMVTASIAVNCARYGEDEITEWISIAAFGKIGEVLARHAKGEMVAVMGPLTRSLFTGRDGQARTGWSITADALMSARTVRPGGAKRQSAAEECGAARSEAAGDRDLNDEIPF